ncbi:sensor histidine kinase [Pengzhenrongella phosphoraccumulans]|uniref:sensor histidine kinase n=1 Tax=Pengzhenrongella phosphoraccumulans TaxID=3114394 RepID=UPI00388DC28C
MSGVEPVFTELNTRRLGPVRRYFLRHPRAMDVLVAALFGVPALLAGIFSDQSQISLGVLAVVGSVALMWRRLYPVWTATAIGSLAAITVGVTGNLNGYDLAIAFAIYAVAVARPLRTTWLTSLVLGITTSGAVWLWQHPVPGPDGSGLFFGPADGESLTDARVSSITSLLIVSLAAIAIGTNVRNRRLHLAALVDRANRLAVERDHQIKLAAAQERTRIAREMHDVVAHSLSVMIALADGASAALDRSPERARDAVTELSETGRTALADMRRVLGVLRDPEAPLGPQPGVTDLAELVEGFRNAGLPVRTTFAGEPLPTDPGLQLAVYRIIQESLTNSLRHARGAGLVDLVLSYAVGRVEITVTDDGGLRARASAVPPPAAGGAGMSAPTRPGSGGLVTAGGKGIIGMRERAAVYGGVVEAGPHAGGWRTHAVLTWDDTPG